MKMKTHKKLFLFFVSCFLIAACNKKELPEIPEENNPIFQVTGTIGDQNINFQAGENNVVMTTSIKSWNNINYGSGIIGNNNSSFSTSMYKHSVDISSLEGAFNELNSYPIANEIVGLSFLHISPDHFENSQYIESIHWTVDGEAQPESDLNMQTPGRYDVCAKVDFVTGFSATTCNTIVVGFKRNADFQVRWDLTPSNVVKCYIANSDLNVSEIKWYVNDTFVSDNLNYNYSDVSDQFHLKAEVLFENGAAYERTVFVNRSEQNFSIGDWANKSLNTTLRWDNNASFAFEKDGVVYQSVQTSNNDASFIVEEINNFSSNQSSHEVKKITGTLNIPFKNTATGEIVTSDLMLEIGVGY